MPLTVVSTPAVSRERTTMGASSAESSPASAAAWICAPNPVADSEDLCDWATTHSRVGSASFIESCSSSLSGPKLLNTMLP